jgi:hypothetical protein
MLEAFKRLLGGRNPLVALGRSGNSVAFAARFVTSDITFLTLPVPELPDHENIGEEEVLDHIKRAATELSRDVGVVPFMYTEGEGGILPIFTSQAAAERFAQKYVNATDRVTAFGAMTVAGKVLVAQMDGQVKVLLNAMGDDEYCLSALDVEELGGELADMVHGRGWTEWTRRTNEEYSTPRLRRASFGVGRKREEGGGGRWRLPTTGLSAFAKASARQAPVATHVMPFQGFLLDRCAMEEEDRSQRLRPLSGTTWVQTGNIGNRINRVHG